MSNLFGNDLTSSATSDNGPILNNIAKQAVVTESVLTLKTDNSVTAVHISPYGKSILNETSVSSLRNKILDADTAIEITDHGVGEINFDVDDVLKMQVTSTDTNIKNNLLVDTTLTANTSVTTPLVIAQTIRSKQGDSEILFQDNGAANAIRFIPGSTNYIQSTSNILSWSKFGDSAVQMKLDHNNTGTSNTGSLETNYDVRINIKPSNLNYCLYRAPGAEQVSLYTHSGADSGGFLCQKTDNGLHIKLNSYHSSNHRNLCLNTSNIGKLIVGSEVEYTDSEKFIVNSTSLF
jgi:hypothetical protein